VTWWRSFPELRAWKTSSDNSGERSRKKGRVPERARDAAKEVGILFEARDTCGFYEHRDWAGGADRVNRETIAATLVFRILDEGVVAARRSGLEVEMIQSPASRCTNIIRPADSRRRRAPPRR
jgi:hypothetical protein